MDNRNIKYPVATIYGDWLNQFGEGWRSQIQVLKEKFQSSIEDVWFPGEHAVDVPVIFVKKSSILEVLAFVKKEPGFEYNFLTDYTATDETPRSPRFDLVWNLFSTSKRWRIRFKVKVEDGEHMPTAIPVWKSADWAEREIWDMFGIKFDGHPNLKRIVMDNRWVGHPLRKDYPLKGYQIFPSPMEIDLNELK